MSSIPCVSSLQLFKIGLVLIALGYNIGLVLIALGYNIGLVLIALGYNIYKGYFRSNCMGYAMGVSFSTLLQKYIITIFLKHTITYTRISLEIWFQWPILKGNVQDISKLYAFYINVSPTIACYQKSKEMIIYEERDC